MVERVKLPAKVNKTGRENQAPKAQKHFSSRSMNSPVDKILFFQRTIGNREVQRLLKSGVLQAKLKIDWPVQLQRDTKTSETAKAVNARASTLGPNIVFGIGQYSQGSMGGKKLLSNELTDIIQQGKGHLMIQRSLANAFSNYRGQCDCGEDLGNNCAHYLSDALIRAGYSELDGGRGALYRRRNGRIVCKAGRPVRARELRDWFINKATTTFNGEPHACHGISQHGSHPGVDTGNLGNHHRNGTSYDGRVTLDHSTGGMQNHTCDAYWAVYQHDSYPGGHVVIHHHQNGTNYSWKGTGDYPAWDTQNHYKW